MARKPRIDAQGSVHHVMARGNARQRIFADDADRIAFLDLLQDGVGRFGHSVHAFCLMDNHIHLALRTGEIPLSRIMQNLMFRYTRHFNRRYGLVGHLFQGRFRSVVVDEGSYLLELVRYIHLNPVRARLVKDPAEWPWSGHRAYLGKERLPFLSTDWVLRQFGPEPRTARRAYERFVLQRINEGRRPEFHTGAEDPRVLGDCAFVEKVLGVTAPSGPKPSLDSIVSLVCEACGLDEAALAAPGRGRKEAEARGLVALLAQDAGAASLTEVARRLGRDLTAMSMVLSRFRVKAKKDAALAGTLALARLKIKGRSPADSE